MISQELFDETVLENEECFDLSPDEAVKETIDQLGKQSQGRSEDCLNYIFQSHPNSTKGQEDRTNCQTFLRALETLDEQYVPKDGIPVIGSREEDDVTQIEEHLSLIRQRCSANIKTKTNDGKTNDTREEDDTDKDTDDSSTNEDDNDQVKTLHIYRQLLLQNGGMYTLMSLLGSRTTSSTEGQGQMSVDVVGATASCLIGILQAAPCPTQSTTTTADSQTLTLRDSFVAWERLVTVLDETNHLTEKMPEQSSESLVTYDTEGEDKALCSLQTKLFTLGRLACQGCETNKVQFVQSRSKYLRKIISNDDNKTTVAVAEQDDPLKKASKNGVKVTLRALSNLVYERKKGISTTSTTTNETTTMTSASSIRAIIEICKLIVTVCRYDDSRSEVSSAHDHAMTFFRFGVVPILFELLKRTLQSLDHEEDNNKLSRETCDNAAREDTRNSNADTQQHTTQVSLSLLLNLAASCMAAVRVTCVNDEIIQHWVAAGLLQVLHSMLHHSGCNDDGRSNNDESSANNGSTSSSAVVVGGERNDSSTSRQYRTILLTNTLGVIRNICGNDEIKTSLCNDQRTVPLLVQHAFQEHVMNANIQDHACGIVAAMALRVPSNTARMLFQYGVGRHIIEAITRHPTSSKVQRQGALAIRNMAARATEVEQVIATTMVANNSKQDDFPELSYDSTVQQPSVKQYLLDLGAEQVLRNVAGMSQRSVEEAYAALRDLGCSVTMLTFDADSSKSNGRTVQMFGDIKPKFRSTFEPSVSLEDFDQRIEEHKQRTVNAN